MERSAASALFSALLQPSWQVLLLSLTVALGLPILLHVLLYRKAAAASLPAFVLLGTSGAGKTSLLTLFESGQPAATRPSQAPQAIELALPAGAEAFSARFRSANDPSAAAQRRFLLTDTPGHGKLRHHALSQLAATPSPLRGALFVVDAANLPANSPELREAAEYLHDALLLLQKKFARAKPTKAFRLLVAANKMDLFTALPEGMARKALELEISEVRHSRATGLMDSGAKLADSDPERDWLGDPGDAVFDFAQMEESGIEVTVLGGVAAGADAPDVDRWWEWIADQL